MQLAVIYNGAVTQVLDDEVDLLDYNLDKVPAISDLAHQIKRAIVIAKEGR